MRRSVIGYSLLFWLLMCSVSVAQVSIVIPAQNALNVSPNITIQVTFNTAMMTSSFNDTTSFLVYGRTSGRYRGSFAFTSGNTVATFTPDSGFKKGDVVTVDLTNKIKTATNSAITPLVFQFTIIANPSTGKFLPKVDYSAGSHPNSVFVSDVDRDGDGDLVVANYSGTVSIFKNNGDGTFQPKTDYATVGSSTSVFVSDLDGDGDGDLAVANAESLVSILKNNGNGTYQTKVDYGTGSGALSSVYVSDVDGDGDGDLVVADWSSNTVSILKNNGDGTFQTKVDYATGSYPISVFVSDLDGDGDGDLAVANEYSYTLSILKNNGDGTFQPKVDYATGIGPRSVFVSDVDGDSDGDLAVASGGNVSILKNNGNGTFQTKVDYATGSGAFSVGINDLDGDGDADLAVANYGSPGIVFIFKNNGNGTFQAKEDYATGNLPVSVFVSDLDGDGDGDLAVVNDIAGTVSILKNIANDVALQSNTPATGFVSLSSSITLSAALKNFSSTSKTFTTLAEVDTVSGNFSSPKFSNTQTITVLTTNETRSVSLGNWSALSNGQYKLRVISQLTEDEDRSNDTLVTTFTVFVPTQPLLVVYESEAQGGTAVKSALTNKGYQYDQYQRLADINFSLSNWQRIVFVAGQDSVLSNTDADSLTTFLNAGKRLLLLGNGLASSQSGDDATTSRARLIREKLGINWVSNFTSNTTVTGIAGDSVGNGVSFTLGLASGSKERTTRAGNFRILDSTMTYSVGGNAGWKRDGGNYKIVYAGFPIHNATTTAMGEQFIDQAMRWLAVPSSLPIVTSISPAQNALAVSPTTTIQVTFNVPMDPASFVDTTSFIVSGSISGRHKGSFAFSASSVILNPAVSLSEVEGRRDEKSQRLGKEILRYAQNDNLAANATITFTPATPFKRGEVVTVDVSSNVKSTNNVSALAFVSQFTIGSKFSSGAFPAKVDYVAGYNPQYVAISDLDSDGDADIVAANAGGSSATVSILKNNGDGTFAPNVDYATVGYYQNVAIGDLDGDGDNDLAVTSAYTSIVSMLKNNGDGTFQPKVDYATGSTPYSVAIGDLDGDGDADLAVANQQGNTASILKNYGDGTFAPKVDYGTGSAPYSVAIGDLDGDGDADLAVANQQGNTASILKNYGDGTFAPKVDYATGAFPTSVAISDFDGDGDNDLAVANVNSPTVSILKNKGDGTFAPKVDYSMGSTPYFVAISDLDGDGDADLAVTSNYNVSILKNNGDGTFAQKVDYGGDGNSVVIGDLDGDGDGDLVTGHVSDYTVSVLKNINGTSVIKGQKFNDLNRNGAKDVGEPGLSNWRINLSGKSNAFILTDVNGLYQFSYLDSGNYALSEEQQSGWNQTAPVSGSYTVSLGISDTVSGKDFGNYQLNTITVRKFEDRDGNFSTPDDRKPYLWSLSLYKDSVNAGTLVGSVSSAANLTANNLVAGTYIAVEADSVGWVQLGKVRDGAPLQSTAASDTIILTTGQSRVVDFVNVHLRIQIRKFADTDGNFSTTGDRRVKKWNLALYKGAVSNDSLIAQVVSAESLEVFNPLSGMYIAVEADSAGWVHLGTQASSFRNAPIRNLNNASTAQTLKRVQGDGLSFLQQPGIADTFAYTSGQLHTVDFINFHPNTVVIRKLQDVDGNFNTTGDRSFKRWNLTLYKDSVGVGNIVQSVASSESMVVTSLGNGTYIAVEADSAAWVHLGKIRNSVSYQGANAADTFSVNGGQKIVVDFVNTQPTIIIRKYQDTDGNFNTSSDRSPKRWHLRLYRTQINPDSIQGEVTSTESLVVRTLTSGTYIAVEADSTGWGHRGTILDGGGAAGQQNQIQFSFNGVQSHIADFVNSPVGSITISKFLDQDGDFRTTGDRTAKAWSLKLYRNSITQSTLIDSVASAPSLSKSNLPEGTYIAVEADSSYPWSHIATVLDDNNFAGAQNYISFSLQSGQSRQVRFINYNRNRIKAWIAAVDCNWDNAYNWDPPGVPIPGDSIIVPDTAKCELLIPPCASLGTIQIASTETIKVQAGGTFSVTGDVIVSGTMIADSSDTSTINVCGNLTLSGGFYAGKSTIVFVGINTQTINAEGKKFFRVKVGGTECPGCGGGGLFATSAHGRRGDTHPIPTGRDGLAKGGREGLENSHPPQARVKTEGSFTVSEALIMDADLDAVGDTVFVINPDPHAVSGSGMLIRGTMRRAIRQQTTEQYRFESSHSYLRFDSTGNYPSEITMTTYPDSFPTNLDTVTTVRRFYDINPSGGSHYKARVSLRFDPLELRTIPRDSLRLYRSTNNGTSWDSIGGVLDSVNNAMIVDSITEFSKWTFGHRPRTVDVEDEKSSIPKQFALLHNYPNPFNPSTVIRYQLPVSSMVTLKIYNVLGQEVKTLVDEIQDAGFKTLHWSSYGVASGVYFYRLLARPIEGGQAGIFIETKKLLLLR